MNKLKEWLIKKDLSQQAFARMIQISPRYVNSLVNDSRVPSRKLATMIEEYTEGEITAVDLLFPSKKNTAE